jgi:hypothetical protein
LEVVSHRNVVGLILTADGQEFRMQWRWSAQEFQSPPEFKIMSHLPDTMLNAPYVNLADVIHLAIANVIKVFNETDENIEKPGEAILIDFMPGQINIDGETVSQGNQARYYFHPRMLMRGLEIVRERQVGFAIRPVDQGKSAILYLSCQRNKWQIHCAISSVGVNLDAPGMPPMAIRQTRTPLQDGSWFKSRL